MEISSTSRRKTQSSETKFLASIIDDNTPLRGRIAILTLSSENNSKVVEKIILFIEYSQCLCLFFLANYKIYGEPTSASVHISVVFNTIFKLFSPANLIPFKNENKNIVVGISIALIASLLLRLIVFLLIVLSAFKKRNPPKLLEIAWKWIFWLQVRVIYFTMGSIWMNFFEAAYKDQIHFDKGQRSAFLVVCMFMFFAEFFFSLVLQTQFRSIIPSKSLLSCKDINIETINLIQKASNQFVRRVLANHLQVVAWIVSIMGTLLSFIQLRLFVYYLSPYQMKSLFYQMYYLVIIIALNFACFTQVILDNTSAVVDMDFVVVLWIVLSVLFVQVAKADLKNRILKLFISQTDDTPEALIHKIIITKDMMKNRTTPSQGSSKSSWNNLILSAMTTSMANAFGLNENITIESKQQRNRLFSLYLESLLQKYPNNDFLRIYTAYHYAKREKLYGLCLKTLGNLRNSSSWKIIVSRSILFHQMFKTITSDYKNQVFKFDLSEYVESTSTLAQIKCNMREQASLQIKICQELLGESPNLANISLLGGRAVNMRKRIEVEKRRLSEKFPEYFLDPHLVFGNYYRSVNHAYENNRLENILYNKKRSKYDKIITSKKFCQENLYREDVCQLIFSAEKESEGVVLYCGGNYQEIFGRDLKGSHVCTGVPLSTRTNLQLFFKEILAEDESAFVGRIQNRFFYNSQEETMSEVSYYSDIIPYISQGLAYYIISKPARTSREAILITQDGTIESFTKSIGHKLNLFAMKNANILDQKNIGLICPELSRVNEAFNLVHDGKISSPLKSPLSHFSNSNSPEKIKIQAKKFNFDSQEQQMSSAKADQITSLYTGEGNTLYLQPFRDGTKGTQITEKYPYRCIINIVTNNSNGSKFIILEREADGGESYGEIQEFLRVNSKRGTTLIKPDRMKIPTLEEDFELNEKGAGWIDFQRLKSEDHNELKIPQLPFFSSRQMTTEREGLFSSEVESLKRISTLTDEGQKREKLQGPKSFSNMLTNRESVLSLKSQGNTPNKIKLEKLFEQSVTSNENTLMFKLFIAGLYIAGASLIILQSKMAAEVNSGFTSLEASKEVLLVAEARNSYLIDLNGGLFYLFGYAQGIYTLSELGAGMDLATLFFHLQGSLFDLKDANLNLLVIADSLDDNERRLLFEKDVRMFDTYFDVPVQTWTNFTNFQACNQMVETTLKAMTEVRANPPNAVPYIQFAIRNLMNDLLVKDSDIADTFLVSLQERKQFFIDLITISYIALSFGVISSGCLYFYVIYCQYKRERGNLLAYTKLNKTAVKTVLDNLIAFRTLIDQNKSLEKLLKDKTLPEFVANTHVDVENSRMMKQDGNGKGLTNSKGLGKPYFWIFFRLLMVAVVMCSSFSSYFWKLKSSFEEIGVKASKLYSVDKLNARIALTRNSLFEMSLTNNTGLVQNTIVNEAILIGIQEMIKMQQDLIENFQNYADGEKDRFSEASYIEDILFTDACGALTGSVTPYNYCKGLINYQSKQGLVSIMSTIERLFTNYYDMYVNSNKTAEALKEIEIQVYQNVANPVYFVVQNLLFVISREVNESFKEAVENGKQTNREIISVILIFLVLAVLTAHFFVVKALKSRENKFKQMLILFPANVVLSNFMLKSYLKKVSNGSFDIGRYEI